MILVVDDEQIVRAVTCKALSCMGFSTCTAVNGKDALQVFEAHADTIKLVIMDLTMPEMNGLEAIERLHERHATLPIILCTGQSSDEIAPLHDAAGVSAILRKPFHMKDLADTVSALIEEKAEIS